MFVAFVVYVLSAGPVVKFCPNPAPKPVAFLYAPLDFACEQFEFVNSFFEWYLALWGVK